MKKLKGKNAETRMVLHTHTHTHTGVLENNEKNSNVQENGKSVEIQNVKYVRILKDVGKARNFKKEKKRGFWKKSKRDRERNWLTQRNAERNWQKEKAGITLIVLVITIIVLIILAGISIMMISGQDGILTRAGNAKVLNDKATIEEKIKLAVIASYNDDGELTVENVISNIEKSLPNAEITGEDFPIIVTEEGYSYEIDSEGTEKNVEIAKREGIKVGDYVNYVPDTAEAYASTKLDRSITGWDENTADLIQETLNWQVLRIYDDGSMDLIGSPTSQDVYFCGGLGYSNGVWILNDICEKLYSKSTKGITARSVNLEDMEKWLTEDGIKARNSYSGGLVKYGETTNYTERKNNWGEYYGLCKPDILYGKPKNESDKYYSEPTKKAYTVEYCTTFEVKQTYYWIEMNNENYGEGANVLKTTDSEGFYWVASRCIYCTYFDVASFELYAYNDFGDYYMADGYNMFDTYGDDCRWMYKVRPVVSLRSDIQVEKCSGTNNTDNMHTIKWN